MKFLVSIILIIILSFIACLYLPWWSIAIAAFLVAVVIPQSAFMSFLCAFCAIFLLWGSLSFWISTSNEHILAHRVSLLILTIDNPYLLILAAAITGALVGGFAALAGSYIRKRTGVPAKQSPAPVN